MTESGDLVKRLRCLAETGTFFETWDAAPLLREAADTLEKQQAALESITRNLHPENKPPDLKWVMDRAYHRARQALE
jgi:hypothetical protein